MLLLSCSFYNYTVHSFGHCTVCTVWLILTSCLLYATQAKLEVSDVCGLCSVTSPRLHSGLSSPMISAFQNKSGITWKSSDGAGLWDASANHRLCFAAHHSTINIASWPSGLQRGKARQREGGRAASASAVIAARLELITDIKDIHTMVKHHPASKDGHANLSLWHRPLPPETR